MGIREWWSDDERRRRLDRRQERASDAKFYTMLVGFGILGICILGDWLGFWTFFKP